MTTLELIHHEIEKLPPEKLDELYVLIRGLTVAEPAPRARGIMEKLREIQIEGPPDFSTNLDAYLSGEKRVDENRH